MPFLLLLCATTLLFALPALAETVTLEAGRDATLIEDPDGAVANGSGPSLFAGRTAQPSGGVRRSLLWFDVAAALPGNALVVDAVLTLYAAPSNPGARTYRLHRVLAAWGEGPASSSGGVGVPSQPGDVTWIHTFFDADFWVRSGGHFVRRESATQVVDESGSYTWGSPPQMANDVRLWTRSPRNNFGWILIGDESAPQTVKRFVSREGPDPTLRPKLTITYRLPGG